MFFVALFPQNKVFSSALKTKNKNTQKKPKNKKHTCSGRYPFSLVIFLQVSGNPSAASWLAEAASPVVLTFFFFLS